MYITNPLKPHIEYSHRMVSDRRIAMSDNSLSCSKYCIALQSKHILGTSNPARRHSLSSHPTQYQAYYFRLLFRTRRHQQPQHNTRNQTRQNPVESEMRDILQRWNCLWSGQQFVLVYRCSEYQPISIHKTIVMMVMMLCALWFLLFDVPYTITLCAFWCLNTLDIRTKLSVYMFVFVRHP